MTDPERLKAMFDQLKPFVGRHGGAVIFVVRTEDGKCFNAGGLARPADHPQVPVEFAAELLARLLVSFNETLTQTARGYGISSADLYARVSELAYKVNEQPSLGSYSRVDEDAMRKGDRP